MTPVPKSGGNCAKEKTSKNIIDRNVHVRLDIREGNGVSRKTIIEDYRVLGIYTKVYNKWLPCAIG